MSTHTKPQWPEGILSDEQYALLLARARRLAPTFVAPEDLVHDAIIVLVKNTIAGEQIHEPCAFCWKIIKARHMEAFRRTLRTLHIFAPQEFPAPPDCSQLAAWLHENIGRFRDSLPPVQCRIFDLIRSEDNLSCVAHVLTRDNKQIRQATRILRKKLRIFLSEYPLERLNTDGISGDTRLKPETQR